MSANGQKAGDTMDPILVIDHDRAAMQRLGLGCLDRGVAVAMAENVCEGVRFLLSHTVSLIVVDAGLLRLTAREHATLFERVAPGAPVVVSVRPETPLDTRVAFELLGFRVLTKPVTAEELLEKWAAVDALATAA
jgi:DNA-binding response OmpR family regulator